MRIYRDGETDLSAALKAFSARFGPRAGMVSRAAQRRTQEVFGAPLRPIEAVRKIIADVRARGDQAVAEYTRKLDGVSLSPRDFRVRPEEFRQAYRAMPVSFRKALRSARRNIERFQRHLRPASCTWLRDAHGGRSTVLYRPLERVAVYAPGGRAAYPSTVLMTVIPAQVAGVREIALVSPCGSDGRMRAETLAAAHEVGLTEAYRIGGAQAIAALAFGTRTIRKADKIVGPGNIFVTLAKREVYGEVGLDMPAGPSEVLVIADRTANPRHIAADLLSQAEHDPASAVLLTPEDDLAKETLREIRRQLKSLSRGQAARSCLERYGFFGVTRDLAQAVELANQFAPEHLELAVARPDELLPKIRSAGAVFLGCWTPESVGDYVAGPSHVLPTGGAARFCSGLSVHDFLRRMSVIKYDRESLRRAAADVNVLAMAEGLDAHARAATIRFEE